MSYDAECQDLIKECVTKREAILKKFEKERKDTAMKPILDGNKEQNQELTEASKWFDAELIKIKAKYNFPLNK